MPQTVERMAAMLDAMQASHEAEKGMLVALRLAAGLRDRIGPKELRFLEEDFLKPATKNPRLPKPWNI